MSVTMKPTIHSNGTNGDELFTMYVNAMKDVKTAIESVQKACPHDRDYYINRDFSAGVALQEHFKRLEKLTDVHNDLALLAMHISNQLDERAKRK